METMRRKSILILVTFLCGVYSCRKYSNCLSCISDQHCIFVQKPDYKYECTSRSNSYTQIRRIYRTPERCEGLKKKLHTETSVGAVLEKHQVDSAIGVDISTIQINKTNLLPPSQLNPSQQKFDANTSLAAVVEQPYITNPVRASQNPIPNRETLKAINTQRPIVNVAKKPEDIEVAQRKHTSYPPLNTSLLPNTPSNPSHPKLHTENPGSIVLEKTGVTRPGVNSSIQIDTQKFSPQLQNYTSQTRVDSNISLGAVSENSGLKNPVRVNHNSIQLAPNRGTQNPSHIQRSIVVVPEKTQVNHHISSPPQNTSFLLNTISNVSHAKLQTEIRDARGQEQPNLNRAKSTRANNTLTHSREVNSRPHKMSNTSSNAVLRYQELGTTPSPQVLFSGNESNGNLVNSEVSLPANAPAVKSKSYLTENSTRHEPIPSTADTKASFVSLSDFQPSTTTHSTLIVAVENVASLTPSKSTDMKPLSTQETMPTVQVSTLKDSENKKRPDEVMTKSISTACIGKKRRWNRRVFSRFSERKLMREIKILACKIAYLQRIYLYNDAMSKQWYHYAADNPMNQKPKQCHKLLRNSK